MTRFDTYTAAAATGTTLHRWRYDLVTQAGEVLASSVETDGVPVFPMSAQPFAADLAQISERSLQFRLVPVLAEHRPFGPGSVIGHDSGNRVRIYAGLVVGGATTWFLKGTMLPDDMVSIYDGVHQVTGALVDTLRPVRSSMGSGFSWAGGVPVETVVAEILAQSGITATVAATGYTMPEGSLGAEAGRETAVRTMLDGCGHELTTTAEGEAFTRPILPSGDDAASHRWHYGGAGGLAVGASKAVSTTRHPAGCKVLAGGLLTSSSSQDLIVVDTDPRSVGRYAGPGESSLLSLRAPYIEGSAQAAAAGHGQLRRLSHGGGIVEFTCSANPAMRIGDLVELSHGDVEGAHRVIAYRLPLEVDGEMWVQVRGVFDPSIAYSFPIDITEGCLTSRVDTFDGPDENLEDNSASGGEGGSPDWTEIGWSWAVLGNRAIQRWPDTWSLAYDNTPMCSSDQQTTVEIGEIPSGRRVGPVARASGAFEGYAALVDPQGRIQLEVWQGGSSVKTLGSHQISGAVSGASVTVKAVGSAVTVEVSGTEVIAAVDTLLTGSHLGMLGFGGEGAQAPSIENFSGSIAS